MSTANHLSNLNVTIEQARDFIVSNLGTPNIIYETCIQFGITAPMIAEIYGGVTEEQVVNFFDYIGLNGSVLKASDSITSQPSSEGVFQLSFTLGSNESESINAGNNVVPSVEVAIGMEGNDALIGNDFTGAALLGGSGDDTYTVGKNGQYLIIDTAGDNDHLSIPYSFDELFSDLINNGRDLVISLGNFGLILPDWQNPDNRIETVTLNGTNYDYDTVSVATKFVANSLEFPSYMDMDLTNINEQIKLFEELATINSTNSAEILDFDVNQIIDSNSLIEYFM